MSLNHALWSVLGLMLASVACASVDTPQPVGDAADPAALVASYRPGPNPFELDAIAVLPAAVNADHEKDHEHDHHQHVTPPAREADQSIAPVEHDGHDHGASPEARSSDAKPHDAHHGESAISATPAETAEPTRDRAAAPRNNKRKRARPAATTATGHEGHEGHQHHDGSHHGHDTPARDKQASTPDLDGASHGS